MNTKDHEPYGSTYVDPDPDSDFDPDEINPNKAIDTESLQSYRVLLRDSQYFQWVMAVISGGLHPRRGINQYGRNGGHAPLCPPYTFANEPVDLTSSV